MELTERQKYVLYRLVSDIREGKTKRTLGGYAGTGKTTLAKWITKFFSTYGACAFTGKAANVLRRKDIPAKTIHSLIYKPVFEYGKLVGFDLTEREELGCDGFIVDEASMVSKEIYGDLCSYGLPIIAIGDHGQLEPVGSDFNLMESPDYTLEEIHRNAGPIAQFAEVLRFGKPARSFPECDQVWFRNQRRLRDEHLVEVDQVICAFNKTRVEMNARIRSALGHTGLLNEGERVMCLKNNKQAELFNGMQGVVQGLYECPMTGKSMMRFLPDGCETPQEVWYDTKQFGTEKPNMDYFGQEYPNPFDYAYCITAHKCVHPDTLVETKKGLQRIKDIPNEGVIGTPFGAKEYINKVVNPPSMGYRFVMNDGYSISITPEHKIEVWREGSPVIILAAEAKVEDVMRLRIGPTVAHESGLALLPPPPEDPDTREVRHRFPMEVHGEVAEWLGLFVANGTVSDSGVRFVKRYPEVVERFSELCRELFGVEPRPVQVYGISGIEVSSTQLATWIRSIDGLSSHRKSVPACILTSPSSVQKWFLRGLFEDGFVNLNHNGGFDHIGWSSSTPGLVETIRVMLLRLGIVTGTTNELRDEILYIYAKYALRFAQEIGFITSSKQERALMATNDEPRSAFVPVTKDEVSRARNLDGKALSVFDYQNARARNYVSRSTFQRMLEESPTEDLVDRANYHFVQLVRISQERFPSMCVEVPDGNRFLQNGFPHGNSQGDEWPKVLVIEQKCKHWDHRRWGYTAVSRAKEHVTLAY